MTAHACTLHGGGWGRGGRGMGAGGQLAGRGGQQVRAVLLAPGSHQAQTTASPAPQVSESAAGDSACVRAARWRLGKGWQGHGCGCGWAAGGADGQQLADAIPCCALVFLHVLLV